MDATRPTPFYVTRRAAAATPFARRTFSTVRACKFYKNITNNATSVAPVPFIRRCSYKSILSDTGSTSDLLYNNILLLSLYFIFFFVSLSLSLFSFSPSFSLALDTFVFKRYAIILS